MKPQFGIPVLAAAVLFVPTAFADTETMFVSVPAGESAQVEFDFAPASYKQLSNPELVSVNLAQGATFATVLAVGKKGASTIEFKAPSGSSTILTVEILDQIDKILPELETRIKPLGLRCNRLGDKLEVTGTIHNPSDWSRFEKILAYGMFKGVVENSVEFSVDAGTIERLRDELVENGVPLAEKGSTAPEDGTISMKYTGNVLSFSGTVYSASDVEKLVRVLKGQHWLRLVDEAKNASTSTVAQAVVNVTVDDALLELGVAFLKVSKTASHNISRDKKGLPIGVLWNGFYDFLTGRHKSAENFRIDANLNSAINMLAENGVIRERQMGTIRFHANGDPGKTLHLGGSMKVTPPASGEGEAPAPQDYDYGFKVVNKNSHRLSAEAAEIDVDFELFGYPDFKNVGGATIVDQKKDSYSPMVRCALDKTVAVAGFEKLYEATTIPSGAPVLRHVPILNWFVASQGEKQEDEAICVLVSIRRVSDDESPMVENTPMQDISYDVNRSNKERIDEEYEKNKKFHGCWEPLNWFSW